MKKLTLYRHPLSGHSHRVELFLSLLGLKADVVDVDLAAGEHQQDAFLARNIFGQVPVIEADGRFIADSNAILVYLAKEYDSEHRWLPESTNAAADVQRFLSVAAGQLAFGPAAARLVNVFGAALDHDNAKIASRDLFAVLDRHLEDRDWLAAEHATIADVANYAYIAHAPEGGVGLDDYPNIRAWLSRIEALPGFIPMQPTAAGLAA